MLIKYSIISFLFITYFIGCSSKYISIGGNDVISHMVKTDYGIYVTEIKVFNDETLDMFPYMIGGIDSLKAKLWYPLIPKRANVSGDVIIEFEVDQNGNINNLEVLSSPWNGYSKREMESNNNYINSESIKAATGFDKVVSDAILATKFIPAIKKLEYVKTKYRITVSFYSHSTTIN